MRSPRPVRAASNELPKDAPVIQVPPCRHCLGSVRKSAPHRLTLNRGHLLDMCLARFLESGLPSARQCGPLPREVPCLPHSALARTASLGQRTDGDRTPSSARGCRSTELAGVPRQYVLLISLKQAFRAYLPTAQEAAQIRTPSIGCHLHRLCHQENHAQQLLLPAERGILRLILTETTAYRHSALTRLNSRFRAHAERGFGVHVTVRRHA